MKNFDNRWIGLHMIANNMLSTLEMSISSIHVKARINFSSNMDDYQMQLNKD